MKVTSHKSNFSGGEISPRLLSRTDFNKYQTSCKRLENFIVLNQGGITRRPGFQMVQPSLAFSTLGNNVRLIPFRFSTVSSYMCEFGMDDAAFCRMRFFADRARVENPPGTPVQVTLSYLNAQIPEVTYTQSLDTLFLFHRAYLINKVVRNNPTTFTVSTHFLNDGPYNSPNSDPTKTMNCTVSVIGTGGTLNAFGHAPFVAGDIGRLVRIRVAATWGHVYITGFINTSSVNIVVFGTIVGGTGQTQNWAFGAFGTVPGHPECGIFYEDRLWLAKDGTLYGSETGDYASFRPSELDGTVTDGHAVDYTLSTDDANRIKHMAAGKVLSLFTSEGEFTVSASSLNEAITPTNIKIVRETTRGSTFIRPQKIDASTLYVQKNQKRIRDYSYDFGKDSYMGKDLTILADHLWFDEKIKEVAYSPEPYSALWVVSVFGRLFSLTYLPEQEIYAWSKHPRFIGDRYDSIGVSSNSITLDEEVWVVVRRFSPVNGVRRFIEVSAPSQMALFDSPEDYSWAKFVDSYLQYSGPAVNTVSGLSHLAGREVTGMCLRATHWVSLPRVVVTAGGSATFPGDPFVAALVGSPYKSVCETVPFETATEDGVSTGKIGRTYRMALRLFQTLGLKVGTRADNAEEIEFRSPEDPMDRLPPMFSGLKRLPVTDSDGIERAIYLETEEPLPATILGITPVMLVND